MCNFVILKILFQKYQKVMCNIVRSEIKLRTETNSLKCEILQGGERKIKKKQLCKV